MADHDATTGVLVDLDGTLLDSVYQQVRAWTDALRAAGHEVAAAHVHAGIGLGGDRLVPWLLGRHVDHAGDIAADHTERFLAAADTLRPTAGALALLDDLERRGVPYTIATSAGAEERAALLSALGREDVPVFDAEGTGSSKPAPDLLLAACDHLEVEPANALMVGDAPWDALAAARVRARPIAVRCGGFSDAVLTGAGAVRIVDDPSALIASL